jgi:16S rRNA processing protein RimM
VDHAARRLGLERKRGSRRGVRAPEPRFLVVGQVVGAHGVRGEVKVEILTDDPHRFGLLEQVFVGPEDQEPVPWPLEGYRLHKGRALLRLKGCGDRLTAATLRGYLVQIPVEEALPLEDGEFFEHQIVGLEVWTVDRKHLGQVAEILYTGANDVYVIDRPQPNQSQMLIPALEGIVLEVDLETGILVVELPEGLP